jgi:hypothetical protein
MGIATDSELDSQTSQDDGRTADDLEPFESPSLHVIDAIATATGTDPVSLPPLYDTIDPEALDAVLNTEATIEVVFEYDGHAVEVTGDGEVLVDGQVHPSSDAL